MKPSESQTGFSKRNAHIGRKEGRKEGNMAGIYYDVIRKSRDVNPTSKPNSNLKPYLAKV